MSGHWYHGTRRGFRSGGALLPRSFHQQAATTAPTNPGMSPTTDSDEWVYLTQDLDLAWAYAWAAPGRGKPKVLIVEPHGRIERDPEHSFRVDAWRCEWARVRKVLTTPTITEAEASSGWQTTLSGAAR